jgi:acetolactate synthase-1/2/3 large subunit
MPVAFFAYPDKPSLLTPRRLQFTMCWRPEEDSIHALEWLADELGARGTPIAPVVSTARSRPRPARSPRRRSAQSIGALMPENAIVADEAVTTGRGFFRADRAAPPHDWLSNMGGSIGSGMPLATGAAVACPDRKVSRCRPTAARCTRCRRCGRRRARGSTSRPCCSRTKSYADPAGELANVGAGIPGARRSTCSISRAPTSTGSGLARGLGVPGARVTDMEEFNRRFAEAVATPGPFLVEVVL